MRQLKRIGMILICLAVLFGLKEWYFRDRAIPEELIALRERYPETAQFVADYPREHGKHHTIDLTGEVEQGTIPLLLQWDERWGYETYGSSMMAITGCGPTSLSMVVCGLTGDTSWDPLAVAAFSEREGYYVPGEGTSWELMTTGAEALGVRAEAGTVSEEYLRNHLSAQTPMICSMYPGDFTTSGHFIVLTGFDAGGNVTVNDPNSPKNSETAWLLETLLPQIRAVWRYE